MEEACSTTRRESRGHTAHRWGWKSAGLYVFPLKGKKIDDRSALFAEGAQKYTELCEAGGVALEEVQRLGEAGVVSVAGVLMLLGSGLDHAVRVLLRLPTAYFLSLTLLVPAVYRRRRWPWFRHILILCFKM